VSHVQLRVREAAAMGFNRCILPARNLPLIDPVTGVDLQPVSSVSMLSELIFGQ
jgi:DNA repair protein RadA/Sms